MTGYSHPETERADLGSMLRYGRFSVPATIAFLAFAVLWPVHPAIIVLVAIALAIQAAIMAYAHLRLRKLIQPTGAR
ncbi:hypothetical protein CKO28_20495 [Rhodovibrio sodomensis]|uniref:DUF4229 domain-containing protein n=1 Tax=Rhodovibrio sodomensis TaxID=1088 RepID=A0ABS1DIV8_9PROT|nr:hypothetical protein [Rhodovibrio sodomensis]MBK1670407.1 hypothetical protein [Rhodovibrio sodomensis]